MTNDWARTVELASNFYVAVDNSGYQLIKYNTGLIDGPVEFRGEMVNIPFHPNVLIVKVNKKEDYVGIFNTYVDKWLS
jgi:hypothetical protein